MKNRFLFTVATLLSTFTFAGGDSTQVQNDTLIKRDFQVSFITPLGTNGMDFEKVENTISVNIFAGHHGGLNGIEVGGFVNSIKQNATGVQAAGFVNVVQQKTTGTQVAGFANYTSKLEGVQASGFVNMAKDSVEGVQASGFANYAHNGLKGIQATGFSNVIYGDLEGVQAAGFTNVTTGKLNETNIR